MAVASWRRMRDEAYAEAQVVQREAEEREAKATEVGLIAAERAAKRKGEKVERDTPHGPVIVARDGLLWLERKGKLHPAHVRAGLRFRRDLERADSDGMISCLALESGGGGYGPKGGATVAMLKARDDVEAALASLTSPMLRPYVVLLAGRGEMLSGPAFVKDPRRADDHLLPCVIALDTLARHYGMIR